jgi:peptidoglycan hydrolase-like protein with peptidoglycan-binding domain
MQKKKGLKVVFFIMLLSCFLLNSISVSAASTVLKIGSQGKSVVKLQKDLKALGYFNSICTGYYGNITSSAVKNLQKKYGLKQDGIAGKSTLSCIEKLLSGTDEKVNVAAAVTSTTKST